MGSFHAKPLRDIQQHNEYKSGWWNISLSSFALNCAKQCTIDGHCHPKKTLCDGGPPPPPPLPPPGKSSIPPPTPPSVPPEGKELDSIEAAAQAVSSYPPPVPYEQAAYLSGKGIVTLDSFDGFRCDISKQLSPFMVVNHSFWLGTTMLPDGRKSTYSFTTQVGDDSGLCMSRVDPSRGSCDGRIHRSVLNGLGVAKLQIGVGTEGTNDQILAEMDFGANTWTGNFKYGSMGGGIVYGLNYFQSITPSLAVGGEGMYIAANSSMMSSYSMLYRFQGSTEKEDISISDSLPTAGMSFNEEKPGESLFYANYNSGQATMSMNYKRCVTPRRVQLAAELQFNPYNLESNVAMGADFNLQRSKLSLCVDGNGRIQSVVEAKLGMTQPSPKLTFSADLNPFTDEMRFGYGISIEG